MANTFLHKPFLEEAKTLLLQAPPCPEEILRVEVAGTSCSIHASEHLDQIQGKFQDTFHGRFLREPQPQPADLSIQSIFSSELAEKYLEPINELTAQLNLFYQEALEKKYTAPSPSAQHSPMLHAVSDAHGQWIFHSRFLGLIPPQGPARLVSIHPLHLRPNIQTLWKFLLPHQLLKVDGALLHASGFVYQDRAHFFAGTSGSGKTTTARNAPPEARILSDELVALRPHPEDPRRFVAYGTPFYGDWNAPGEDIYAPLEGIHFLKHADKAQRLALPPKEAFQRLARVFCFSFPTQEEQSQLMDLLDRLLPLCDRLALPPTNEYVSLL
ncbi:MAG: hypothetical protein H6727_14915 [Myxococcales bacterium]|nr:hypothetical protein [Myxococcales bacterium]